MFRRYFLCTCIIILIPAKYLRAQYDAPLYASYTTLAERTKLYDRLINNSIVKNLSGAVNDSNEENWESAFNAMELMNYRTSFTLSKIREAFDSILQRSIHFQRALLEVAYANYPGEFITQTNSLINNTTDPKIFAMCAEYLIQPGGDDSGRTNLYKMMIGKFKDSSNRNPILFMLGTRLKNHERASGHLMEEVLHGIADRNFLPHQVVMYSFQRKDRDFPGMVLIRNASGQFVTDSSGNILGSPSLREVFRICPGI